MRQSLEVKKKFQPTVNVHIRTSKFGWGKKLVLREYSNEFSVFQS
jgi:hypothetical protein